MIPDLTWVRLLLGAAGTVVYFMVGIIVGRRRTSREGTTAMQAFQVWWFGLALLTVFAPLMKLLDLLPSGSNLLTFRIFLLESVLVLIMVAIGALIYYLLYLYLGKSWVMWPVIIYAFLETTWLITLVSQAHPIDYGPHCPSASFCYETDLSKTPTSSLLSLSISLPILFATAMYFTLFFRVENAVQKRRVAMVAGALALWFGSSFVASLIRGDFENSEGVVVHIPLSQSPYWSSVVSPVISLAASLIIYWAYRMGAPAMPVAREPVPAP